MHQNDYVTYELYAKMITIEITYNSISYMGYL